MNIRQPTWQDTYTQKGDMVTLEEVQGEFIAQYADILKSKLSKFEDALEKKCEEYNEVYRNMGFDPRVGNNVYQVGMGVFTIQTTPDGLVPIRIGQF